MTTPSESPSTSTPASPKPARPTLGRKLSDWSGRSDDDSPLEWVPSAFTLIDVIDTFVDSRLDLFERRLRATSDKLRLRASSVKTRAAEALSGGIAVEWDGPVRAREVYEREVAKYKLKVSTRVQRLAQKWRDATVVRTRDKLSFCFGVFNVLLSALLYGNAPEWVHIAYTAQALYFLPVRIYTYRRKSYHYFLFDMCYYATLLNLAYIWLFPASQTVFIAAYCMTMGPLAWAVATWRNSLVFHSLDKVTSLFIHIYPPLVFHVIVHDFPGRETRFPALTAMPRLEPVKALLYTSVIYLIWQGLYWRFILVGRRDKIGEGEGKRTTSFSYLVNDKRGAIGRALEYFKPRNREWVFMLAQFLYTIFTMLPAVFFFYNSSRASGAFLLFIFGVSTWNGACYYVEVFGRRFERELESLRKELEAATSSPTPAPTPTPAAVDADVDEMDIAKDEGDHGEAIPEPEPMSMPEAVRDEDRKRR